MEGPGPVTTTTDREKALVMLAAFGDYFIPAEVVEKHGSPESVGPMIAELEKVKLVTWAIDPVSGMKRWELTEKGRELAEKARAKRAA